MTKCQSLEFISPLAPLGYSLQATHRRICEKRLTLRIRARASSRILQTKQRSIFASPKQEQHPNPQILARKQKREWITHPQMRNPHISRQMRQPLAIFKHSLRHAIAFDLEDPSTLSAYCDTAGILTSMLEDCEGWSV